MRRLNHSLLGLAGLAGTLLVAAGCGGSGSVTGAEDAPVGHGVIAGTIEGGGFAASSTPGFHALSRGDSGIVVTVEGTSLQAIVDEEGEFALAGVPAGTVILHFQGPGVDARLTVSGLLEGQVLSLKVHVSGTTAEATTAPTCSPTSEVKFTGVLESVSGSMLVVGGRSVDTSEIRKVWRGDHRTTLDDLEIGEKVKVWGTLRGDGVVVAEEISALSSDDGNDQVHFRGKVESLAFSALDVHGNPNGGTRTLVVKGHSVKVDSGTRLKWSDGTALDVSSIQVGDVATVDGRQKDGYVLATKLVVDCR